MTGFRFCQKQQTEKYFKGVNVSRISKENQDYVFSSFIDNFKAEKQQLCCIRLTKKP
jgi:hypothetical protein